MTWAERTAVRLVPLALLAGLAPGACVGTPKATQRPPNWPEAPQAGRPAATSPEGHASERAETLRELRFRLLEEQDTDCDQKITSDDPGRRPFRFRFHHRDYETTGHYHLANLLQELTLALRSETEPRLDRIEEDPIDRTSRLIRTQYWDRLTRSIDERGLAQMLRDDKVDQRTALTLYVPASDPLAFTYLTQVGRRYDEAYAEVRRGVAQVSPQHLLSPSNHEAALQALLGTTQGRRELRELNLQLRSVAPTTRHAALARELEASSSRLAALIQQADRSCVHSSPPRIERVAKKVATELEAFRPRSVQVARLPPKEQWPIWVNEAGREHGPLSLALRSTPQAGTTGVPFVVPGGRFNEMYGWDSYFIALGLIVDGRLDLATSLVDNFAYAIQHYGATLNANRTYYLTRSQPPLFAAMIRAVWEATPPAQRKRAWLRGALRAAIREYERVWTRGRHVIASLCDEHGPERVCLARYEGGGIGQPPEVERGHFDGLWQELGRSLEESYRSGTLDQRELSAELDQAFRHDRCMRESGHDTTYRWFWKSADARGRVHVGNRCADMASVDLNSLLYRYEVDVAHLLRELRGGASDAPRKTATPEDPWCQRAARRMALMQKHLWSDSDGLFYDAYVEDAEAPVRTGYVSATTLYPLWATANDCDPSQRDHSGWSSGQRARLVSGALSQLEAAGGLLATAKASRDRFSNQADRQWEYPNGWAPHQMLAWAGLTAHGFDVEARRLALAWLSTLLTNVVDFNGTIPEKYDVVERTHAVFAEYGNVGADFDYLASEGFGWVNASFQVGLKLLGPEGRQRLRDSLDER